MPRSRRRGNDLFCFAASELSADGVPSLSVPVRLNNLGARMIESKRFSDGIDAFKKSMSSLKSAIQQYAKCKKRTRQDSERKHVDASFEQTLSPEDLHRLSELWNETDSSDQAQPELFLFQFPLKISQDELYFPESYTEISIILTYNLALAYHLHAMSQDMLDVEKLHKALDLYGMTLNLLLRDQSFKHNTVTCTTAILNNMGSLHYILGNQDFAKKFFNRMLSIIMIELAANRKEELKVHLNGFFQNINRLLYEQPSAAAA
mmetsp:Transcript_13965/g.20124  ORF Transcript_13965/g.20124 Transcript_13965/m.20124 type:complete len:262 (+) Transcript_13965:165-950(+)|eukprot:CAMPEP_0202448912 /NCGR_PEP_ID=MMETSP1360-20130828/7702_1 /ASSEMBLY_ACC=CAM_ASM_000848 /TAXON_ID=515479 /ORGANISM="Licmophora paradoxa, Strain CCMP2313" /LENGTH=261 /DNA_ID=CAMNT_0049066679 /DNA_START=148 /DNA_END=933 /DNA_ORIENTATION=+